MSESSVNHKFSVDVNGVRVRVTMMGAINASISFETAWRETYWDRKWVKRARNRAAYVTVYHPLLLSTIAGHVGIVEGLRWLFNSASCPNSLWPEIREGIRDLGWGITRCDNAFTAYQRDHNEQTIREIILEV